MSNDSDIIKNLKRKARHWKRLANMTFDERMLYELRVISYRLKAPEAKAELRVIINTLIDKTGARRTSKS